MRATNSAAANPDFQFQKVELEKAKATMQLRSQSQLRVLLRLEPGAWSLEFLQQDFVPLLAPCSILVAAERPPRSSLLAPSSKVAASAHPRTAARKARSRKAERTSRSCIDR